MFTYKEGTYIVYHHFRPENHMGSGLLTCDMVYPSKVGSVRRVGGWKTT